MRRSWLLRDPSKVGVIQSWGGRLFFGLLDWVYPRASLGSENGMSVLEAPCALERTKRWMTHEMSGGNDVVMISDVSTTPPRCRSILTFTESYIR